MEWTLPPWSGVSSQPIPTPAVTTHVLAGERATRLQPWVPPSMDEPWMVIAHWAGWLLTVQPDGSVSIRDGAQQGKVIHAFCCLNRTLVTPVDVSADLNRLAYGNEDGTVDVWDIASGSLVQTFMITNSVPLERVVLVPDGRRLVVAMPGKIEIWDRESEQPLRSFPNRWAGMALFTPDGQAVVIGTCEGDVDVWDLDTAELLFTLAGHTGCVTDLALSPDGKYLAVGQSAPITIWDWDAHAVVARVGLPTGTLSYSPDGARLAAMTFRPQQLYAGKTTQVLLTQTADLMALARSRLTRALNVNECRQYLHQDSCS